MSAFGLRVAAGVGGVDIVTERAVLTVVDRELVLVYSTGGPEDKPAPGDRPAFVMTLSLLEEPRGDVSDVP